MGKNRGGRYKRGMLAGIIAGAVMAVGYMVLDWLAPSAAAGTAIMRDLGFIYYLARIGVGFIIGLVWGVFYAAVEEHLWGVGFLKGMLFGAAVWLLGGLPEALNKYLTFEFGGLIGLWALGGLAVSILGGVTVSLVYGRVDYDDTKRKPVKIQATITGGDDPSAPPPNDLPLA